MSVDPQAVHALIARCNAEVAHPSRVWADPKDGGPICDHFAGWAWGLEASGQVDAAAHWAAIPADRKHPGDAHDAPPGALVFFDPDHVTVAAGGLHVYSTDILRPGKVDLVPISLILDRWGSFLHGVYGWTDPLFPGMADFGRFNVTAAIPPHDLQFVDVYGGDDPAAVNKALLDPKVAGVIVKAAEGDTPDKRHDAIVLQARNAHKLVGHYFYPWMSHDPVDSAVRLFLHVAKPLPGEVLVLDFEETPPENGGGPAQWLTSWPQRVNWTLKFLAAVNQATHANCWLYCNTDDWGNILANVPAVQKAQLLSHPLWIADPNDTAGSPATQGHPWAAQQFGISGGLDRDVFDGRPGHAFDGTAAAWKALGVQPTAPGSKPPVAKPPAQPPTKPAPVSAPQPPATPAPTPGATPSSPQPPTTTPPVQGTVPPAAGGGQGTTTTPTGTNVPAHAAPGFWASLWARIVAWFSVKL